MAVPGTRTYTSPKLPEPLQPSVILVVIGRRHLEVFPVFAKTYIK